MMELTNISVIKELLARNGFHFSKSLGQNFLTASWVPEDIAAECMATEDCAVLEIGPGIGCLTQELAQGAANVLSIELDTSLAPILKETMAPHSNVEIFYGDALKEDITGMLNERFPEQRCVACANLPYNITTPVLARLYECERLEYITVMIQREVALRLCAKPGTRDYGAFSVFTQWHTEPELLFDVPASSFMPQPKVTSSVIRLKRRTKPAAEVEDVDLFFRLVRASFNQRRKTLVNGIQSALGGMAKADIEQAVREAGLPDRVRGETLGIEEFARLANIFKKLQ